MFNQAMVSWPVVFADYLPQRNSDLTNNWVDDLTTPMTNEVSKFILVAPNVGSQTYRLKKP